MPRSLGQQGLLRVQFKKRHFVFHPVTAQPRDNHAKYGIAMLGEDRTGQYLFIGANCPDGLYVLDRRTGKERVVGFDPTPTEKNLFVRAFRQTSDGNIWILTYDAIYRFNFKTCRLERPIQPPLYSPDKHPNGYTELVEDLQGNLWLGTAFLGVIRYAPSTGKADHYTPDENRSGAIAINVVGVMGMDGRGRMWYGSRDKTAYGYHVAAEDRFVYLNKNGQPTTEVATLRVNSIYTDPAGNIWASTEEGLLHFDCTGDQPRLLKKYTFADGLPSEYVVSCAADKSEKIWCITASGLSRIDPATHKILHRSK